MVFSLKNTPYNLWVMMAYIVWEKNLVKQTQLFAKQNVSRVLSGLALLARHS